MFYVFTSCIRQPTVSDGPIFLCLKKDRGERHASSSQAPHPSFCLSGQKLSRSTAPPLPTKPTYVGLWRGPCWRPLESPGVNSDRKPDVLCANRLAMVRVTRLSRLRRSAYPLASACCGCPARTKDLRNHLTSDYKSGRLFSKCQRIRRSWSSTTESVETVCLHTPRTGLNRVNCTRANS